DQGGGVVVCRVTAAGEEVLARFTAQGPGPFRGAWLSGDGRHALIGHGAHPQAAGASASLAVWQLDGGEPRQVLADAAGVGESAVAFRPGGRQGAVGHPDGTVGVSGLGSGRRARRLAVGPGPQALAFHPDPRDGRLAVACGSAVRLFDVDRGTEDRPLRHGPGVSWISGLAWHPDGRRLAT